MQRLLPGCVSNLRTQLGAKRLQTPDILSRGKEKRWYSNLRGRRRRPVAFSSWAGRRKRGGGAEVN